MSNIFEQIKKSSFFSLTAYKKYVKTLGSVTAFRASLVISQKLFLNRVYNFGVAEVLSWRKAV